MIFLIYAKKMGKCTTHLPFPTYTYFSIFIQENSYSLTGTDLKAVDEAVNDIDFLPIVELAG